MNLIKSLGFAGIGAIVPGRSQQEQTFTAS